MDPVSNRVPHPVNVILAAGAPADPDVGFADGVRPAAGPVVRVSLVEPWPRFG
jgi:hypothetical protein